MRSTAFSDWLEAQFEATPSAKARTVAAEAGITEGYLSALRSGRNERASRDRAERLAVVFATLRSLSEADTQALVDEALQIIEISEPSERRNAPQTVAVPRRVDTRRYNASARITSFDEYFQHLAAYYVG